MDPPLPSKKDLERLKDTKVCLQSLLRWYMMKPHEMVSNREYFSSVAEDPNQILLHT